MTPPDDTALRAWVWRNDGALNGVFDRYTAGSVSFVECALDAMDAFLDDGKYIVSSEEKAEADLLDAKADAFDAIYAAVLEGEDAVAVIAQLIRDKDPAVTPR